MSAATARLWTGIGAVGSLLVVAVLAVSLDLPGRLLPATRMPPIAEAVSIAGLVVGFIGLLLPFDLIGGLLIPAACEDQPPHPGAWAKSWLRGVGVQAVLFTLTLFVYLQIGREVGTPWLTALFAVVQVSLLAGQELIWRVMTQNRPVAEVDEQTTLVTHRDQRFAGGVTGLPGFETILLPQRWKQQLDQSTLQTIVSRRKLAVRSGGRSRGVLMAMLWNLTCFALAVVLSGPPVTSVADLARVYSWYLLLSFGGLILLPTINRSAVVRLDRRCAGDQIGNPDRVTALKDAITAMDRMTERDPVRSARSESIFQPIPCPERRGQLLDQAESKDTSFWNVARTTLYLSWAFAGPLSRAVHCNVGRPELWALLPTD